MRRFLVAGAFVAITTVVGTAQATSKQACAEAHGEAQRLRKAGSLMESRERLLICGQADCPGLIQRDCTNWLPEVDQRIPSVVVAATGPDGQDTTAVQVFVNGQLRAQGLDGRPIRLDPGPHELRFVFAGKPPIERRVVVQEGVRARPLQVSFANPVVAPAPVTPGLGSPDEGPGVGVAVGGWVLAGLAVGSFGAFTGFGLAGLDARDDYVTLCETVCTQEDRDGVEQKFLLADIFLGTGVGLSAVSLGMLVYYYLSQPEEVSADRAGWRLELMPAGGPSGMATGGIGRLTVSF